jgi:hypothetical protein
MIFLQEGCQVGEKIPAQGIQGTKGHEQSTGVVPKEDVEGKGCSAAFLQLPNDPFRSEGMGPCLLPGQGGDVPERKISSPAPYPALEDHRLSLPRQGHLDRNRPVCGTLHRLGSRPLQRSPGGKKYLGSLLHTRPVKREKGSAAVRDSGDPQPRPFAVVGSQEDPIPGLRYGIPVQPDMDSPGGGIVSGHHTYPKPLVIRAGGPHDRFAEEVPCRGPPVEGEQEIPQVFRPRVPVASKDSIDGHPVDADHRGYILRGFHASLDLKGLDGQPEELFKAQIGGEIAGGETVSRFREDLQREDPVVGIRRSLGKKVGFSAGLGASATVSAPSPDNRREQALSGVTVAEGSVDEDLQTDAVSRLVFGDASQGGDGELPRQNNPFQAHTVCPIPTPAWLCSVIWVDP